MLYFNLSKIQFKIKSHAISLKKNKLWEVKKKDPTSSNTLWAMLVGIIIWRTKLSHI